MNDGQAIIEVRELRKIYRVGDVDVAALRGLDLDVLPAEFLSIVGPSGSGKSTLFHIIGGLAPPTSGRVRVADRDLATMTEAGRTRLRRRTVSFVFQKFNLLPNLTARDNIAVARHLAGLGPKPDAQFEEVVRLLGIARRLDHKPNALSGGEQQRVAIARAIVNHPAGRRTDRQSGHRQLESGAGNPSRPQRTPRPDNPHDHAQPGSGGLWASYCAHARRADCGWRLTATRRG